MQRLTRTSNRSQQSAPQRKATSYKTNVATVTKLLSNGYLPMHHDSLPVPFKSFEVETDAGKQYVIQVRGRESAQLGDIQVGFTVEYGGVFVFPRYINNEWKGGFFLASRCEVLSKEIDEYTQAQIAAKARIQASEGIEEVPAQ